MEVAKMLNDRQAAEFLNVGLQTLRNWRSQHRGPSYHRLGRLIRYNGTDLERYLESKKIKVNG